MSINWHDAKCIDSSDKERFGLCDDQNDKLPAYIDEADEELWIATVENPSRKLIDFLAIDNCILIQRSASEMEKRADCMISYDDTIIFVELKDKSKGWAAKAFKQIEKTVELFHKDGGLDGFKTRKAYASHGNRNLINYNNVSMQQRFEKWDMSIHAENIITIL